MRGKVRGKESDRRQGEKRPKKVKKERNAEDGKAANRSREKH